MAIVSVANSNLQGEGRSRSIANLFNGPFATGGDSVFLDGNDWVHIFNNSGTFTPLKSLDVEY